MIKNYKLVVQLVVIILAIFLNACQEKDNDALKTPAIDKDKVANLVEQMYQVSDAAGDQAITNTYASLNAGELDYLNELRVRYDLAKLEQEYQDPNSLLNPETYELSKAQVKLTLEMRRELNVLSQSKYGKASNNISTIQVSELSKQLLATSKYNLLEIPVTASPSYTNGKVLPPPVCQIIYMPLRAFPGSKLGSRYASVYFASILGPNNCDYVFRYARRSLRYVFGAIYLERRLIALSNPIPLRYTVGTEILFDSNLVISIFGSGVLPNLSMY